MAAAPQAWLVTVRMEMLAAHLKRSYGQHHTVFDAKRWLTQHGSPFYWTDRWATFYTIETPSLYLEPDEIEAIDPVMRLKTQGDFRRDVPIPMHHIRAGEYWLPKPVRAVETKREYPSLNAAVKSLGLNKTKLLQAIEDRKEYGGLHWERIAV